MSDTPRTDKAAWQPKDSDYSEDIGEVVGSDFARELERDLAAKDAALTTAIAKAEQLQAQCDSKDALIGKLKETLAEAVEWNWLDHDLPPADVEARVDAALAATPETAAAELAELRKENADLMRTLTEMRADRAELRKHIELRDRIMGVGRTAARASQQPTEDGK